MDRSLTFIVLVLAIVAALASADVGATQAVVAFVGRAGDAPQAEDGGDSWYLLGAAADTAWPLPTRR